MKNKIYIFFVLFSLIFYSYIFSQHGYLKIICNKDGLKTVVNDSTVGLTPVPVLTLKSGSYHVQICNPKKGSWNYDDWEKPVEVIASDTTKVNIQLNKSFSIRTDPFDAQVFINNQYYGNTPAYLELPGYLTGTMRIIKKNYEPYIIDLSHVNNSQLKVKLEANSILQQSSLIEEAKKRQKFTKYRNLTYSFMALTLASGFSSAYFKDAAENKYDQYLHASDIQSMNNLYKDAEKADHYSSVSFGIFEVSFLLTFYCLFKTVED